MLDGIKLGQVWRRFGSTYGDIDSWQVVAVGKRVTIVTNCATMKEVVLTRDTVDSFTSDYELISERPRFPELQH